MPHVWDNRQRFNILKRFLCWFASKSSFQNIFRANLKTTVNKNMSSQKEFLPRFFSHSALIHPISSSLQQSDAGNISVNGVYLLIESATTSKTEVIGPHRPTSLAQPGRRRGWVERLVRVQRHKENTANFWNRRSFFLSLFVETLYNRSLRWGLGSPKMFVVDWSLSIVLLNSPH